MHTSYRFAMKKRIQPPNSGLLLAGLVMMNIAASLLAGKADLTEGIPLALLPGNAAIPADPDDPEARRPLQFEERDVARVEFQAGDAPMTFSRPAGDAAFEGHDLSPEDQPHSDEIARLVILLVHARFTEIVEKTAPEVADARGNIRTVRLELFNGDTYTLSIGRRPAYVPQGLDDLRMSLPGPVFIFYESTASDFPWREAFEQVALKFPDKLFFAFPESQKKSIQTGG